MGIRVAFFSLGQNYGRVMMELLKSWIKCLTKYLCERYDIKLVRLNHPKLTK